MGLLDLLMPNSGIANWADSNQGTLGAFSAGLARGPDLAGGFSNAAQLLPQGKANDRALQLQIQQRNATADWLEQQGRPDLARLAMAGGGAEALQRYNRPPIVVPNGSYLANPDTAAPMGGQGPSAFAGTDMKAQAWNLILKGQSDPSVKETPEYQTAVSIVSQPTTQMVQTPQGMVPTQIAPVLPAYLTQGQQGQQSPQMGSSPPAVGDAAANALASGQVSAGPPSGQSGGNLGAIAGKPLPGTAPAPNESQNRLTMLSGMGLSDLPTAIANFQALTNPKDQALQKIAGIDPTGLAKGAQDPHFQQAAQATQAIISNVLYGVSGAAISDPEMQRKVQDLTPQLGDHTAAIADKLRRLGDYVGQIASTSRDPDQIAKARAAEQALPEVVAQITKNDPISVDTPAQAAALPHGSYFKAPDGKIRINP